MSACCWVQLARQWHAAVCGLLYRQQCASLGQAVGVRPAQHMQQPAAAAAVMVMCGQHSAGCPRWLSAGPLWRLPVYAVVFGMLSPAQDVLLLGKGSLLQLASGWEDFG